MKDSPHHRKHEKHKNVQEANKIVDSGALPEEMIVNKEFKKQFEAAKECPSCSCHSHKKTSKRTSPGQVKGESEPSHIHQENERWHQVVQNQNNQNAKSFDHKQQKNKH